MKLTRYTKLNLDLIRNLPSAMKSELIVFEGVIPDGIMTSLYVNDSFYKKERSGFLNHHPDLLEKMYHVRNRRNELSVEESINAKTDEKIQFVKDYPQFKQLIDSIIFEDDNGNVVEVVPIDQYLTEN